MGRVPAAAGDCRSLSMRDQASILGGPFCFAVMLCPISFEVSKPALRDSTALASAAAAISARTSSIFARWPAIMARVFSM
jgi:hypothetical protein